MTGTLRVEEQALRAAERRLTAVGRELSDAATPVGEAGRGALSGAGQFAGDLDAGVTTFVLSWRAVLDVFGDSAAAVARLAGHTVATTHAADQQLTRVAGPR